MGREGAGVVSTGNGERVGGAGRVDEFGGLGRLVAGLGVGGWGVVEWGLAKKMKTCTATLI